jgi:hypothetical protein
MNEIKGRVILQDLPKVIEDISEPLPGVEKMGYDFFTPQPIKGKIAQAYVCDKEQNSSSPPDHVLTQRRSTDILHPPLLTRLVRQRMYQNPEDNRSSNGAQYISCSHRRNGHPGVQRRFGNMLDGFGNDDDLR